MTAPQTDTAGSAGLEVADVLERAAALIEPEGCWIQEDYCNETRGPDYGIQASTCWCAEGAIAKVLGIDGPDGERWADHYVVPLGILGKHTCLAGWNDEDGRTQAEVVAKLREAAALSRAGRSS